MGKLREAETEAGEGMCWSVELPPNPHLPPLLHHGLRHPGHLGGLVVLYEGGGHVLSDGQGAGEPRGPDGGHPHPASPHLEADAVVLVLRGRSEAAVASQQSGGVEAGVERGQVGQQGTQAGG